MLPDLMNPLLVAIRLGDQASNFPFDGQLLFSAVLNVEETVFEKVVLGWGEAGS